MVVLLKPISNTHKKLKNDSNVRVNSYELSQFKLKKQTVACSSIFTSCRYRSFWTNVGPIFTTLSALVLVSSDSCSLTSCLLCSLMLGRENTLKQKTISWKMWKNKITLFKCSLKNSVRNVKSTWGNLTPKFPEKYTEHMTLFCYDSHNRSAK